MAASILDEFFRKLESRDVLSAEERDALLGRVGSEVSFKQGEDLVREGDRPDRSMLVIDGFTTRYRLLASGQRQITAIHMPGDFVDLHSLLLKEMDHSVGALSNCRVVTFPHKGLVEITEQFPHLTRLLWLSTVLDGAIHREWLVAMGRRSAAEQLAHLICELYLRMNLVGRAPEQRFQLPITQVELGDVLGLSAVHVNRVLQELRAEQLLTWQGDHIHIIDWPRLQRRAEFDPRYLHLVNEPR